MSLTCQQKLDAQAIFWQAAGILGFYPDVDDRPDWPMLRPWMAGKQACAQLSTALSLESCSARCECGAAGTWTTSSPMRCFRTAATSTSNHPQPDRGTARREKGT